MAESYPSSVFVLDNGEIFLDYWGYKGPKESITGRLRRLTDVAVPASALHGTVCVADGRLLDVFTPQREDFLKA